MPEPSGFIRKMSTTGVAEQSSRLRTNAIRSPDGDQAGCRSDAGSGVEILTTLLPSAFMTYNLKMNPPSRKLENTILLPSGDHEGFTSSEGGGVLVRLV